MIAEFLGSFPPGAEGAELLEQHDPVVAVDLVQDLIVAQAVEAAIQGQVCLFGLLAVQLVLTIGVQQIQLRFQGVGVVQTSGRRSPETLVGFLGAIVKQSAVIVSQQAETRYPPTPS